MISGSCFVGLAAGLCAIVGTVLGPGLSKGIGGTRGKKDYGAILAMKPASAYSFFSPDAGR